MSKFKKVVWLAGFGLVAALGAFSAGSVAAQSPSAAPAAPHARRDRLPVRRPVRSAHRQRVDNDGAGHDVDAREDDG